MIPNHWYALIEASDVGKRPVSLKRMGQSLVLWRDGAGEARAFLDRCPHRGVALSRGKVRDGRLVCPYHGLEFEGGGGCARIPFQGAKGEKSHIPKGLDAKSLPVFESHGLIWLWWGEGAIPLEERPPIPWPEALPAWDDPAWARVGMEWPQHISRCVESNFDFYHAAFLHGRWLPTLSGGVNRTECHDRPDGGFEMSQDLDQGKRGDMGFKATFLPPSVSVIAMGESLLGVVFDCPIDEQTTWRTTRFIQTVTRVPGLRWLTSWLALQSDWSILQRYEDIPIARTMEPSYPQDGDHKLLAADAGIARYRRWRRRSLRALTTSKAPSKQPKAIDTPESQCPAPALISSPPRSSAPS